MHALIRVWLPLQGVMLLLGCASPAPAPPDRVARTAAAAPAATTNAAGIDPSLIKLGYHARKVNGEWKYCRSELVTGSMFSNTVCLTPAEIKARDVSTQGSVDTLGRGHATCFNNKCD